MPTAQQIMGIAWPAFLSACVLEVVVFAVVDPLELLWFGRPLAWSRQAVYTAGVLRFLGLQRAGQRADGATCAKRSGKGRDAVNCGGCYPIRHQCLPL